MPTYFRDQAGLLNLFKQSDTPNQGFRPGQLGALHSVMAHFSVQDDPAIICLPTGYGKTSLMMALPYVMGARRVLIVEPTSPLRKQVHSHVSVMSTLRRIGALPAQCPLPRTLLHIGIPESAEEWDALTGYDLVVSTAASSSPVRASGAPAELFDLIIFDEAHHAPADSWSAYLTHYSSARFVFLTATPFRRDSKPIPGKLAYRYPVMRATEEGAFEPIQFSAVAVENELDDDHVDRAIARAAVAQLVQDRAAGFDHRLFVRAASIQKATELVPIYREMGIAVEAVSSKLTKSKQDAIEDKLKTGALLAIVCVDMFGEGYDFPKLKVAALHAPHQSLVATIQFIGRFARVDDTTGPPTLVAPAFRIKAATASLLKEGVNLALMIDQAAIQQIEGTQREQELLDRFPVRKITEANYDAVTPLSFELFAHVRVFKCNKDPDLSLLGDRIGKQLKIVKQWGIDNTEISLCLTAEDATPRWSSNNDSLMDVRHDIFLLMYFKNTKYCFVTATRRTEKLYLSIMRSICPDGSRALSYEETSRARAGLLDVKFFNVGLKNNTFNSQGETYRMLTGPQAERAVTVGDSRVFSQGHFFGAGMNGEIKETIGASSSSRIWSNQYLSIADLVEWIETLNDRMLSKTPFTATQLDLIRSTTRLKKIPAVILAANWPKNGFKNNPRVRFRALSVNDYKISKLTDWDFHSFNVNPQSSELVFTLENEDGSVDLRFSVAGSQMITSINTSVQMEVESSGDAWMPIADWLSENSPVFYASDKSSFEGMNLTEPPLLQSLQLTNNDTQVIDWEPCSIGVEFLPDSQNAKVLKKRAALVGKPTVQEHLQSYLLSKSENIAVFYDHRSGEAADYICIKRSQSGDVNVSLYHCKGAGGIPSGGRVGDVYEVAGQLVKSVYYCSVSTVLKHMKDRMSSRHKHPSKFFKGDIAAVTSLLTSTVATKISFTVVGVQPGIKKSAIGPHLSDLMAFCLDYARQGGATEAYWLVNEPPVESPQV
ncbi:DEAD/DEAH box helicase [Enterobacter mori]